MALLLSNPNDTLVVASKQLNIFGTQSGQETVKILDNQFTDIHLDSNIEILELPTLLSDYQFQLTGNSLQINTNSHPLVDVVLGSTPIKLVFADGSENISISGLGNALLGTTQIPTIMQSLNGVFLDKTHVSSISDILHSFSIVQDINNTNPVENSSKTVNVSSNSTDDQGGNNFENAEDTASTFVFEAGSYLYTIKNFGEDDRLDIPDGSKINIKNLNKNDGAMDIYISDNAGSSFQIHLLGIESNIDRQINSVPNFEKIFGSDSFI